MVLIKKKILNHVFMLNKIYKIIKYTIFFILFAIYSYSLRYLSWIRCIVQCVKIKIIAYGKGAQIAAQMAAAEPVAPAANFAVAPVIPAD